MDEEPIEPEVVGHGEGRTFMFRSVAAPWALFGLLGAFGALGIAAVLALIVGWFFALPGSTAGSGGPPSRLVTRLVYGADTLTYGTRWPRRGSSSSSAACLPKTR